MRMTPEQFEAARNRLRPQMPPHTESKYGNRRFVNEEGRWDSKREYARWCDLKLLQSSGKISELRRQVVYDLLPQCTLGGRRHRPIRFVADFVYIEDGEKKVEDSKGFKNRLYMLKRRLMWQLLGIEVIET
jgi:uncharacterized protein DUF1064